MNYKDIYLEFINNKKFKSMSQEIHHGTSRLEHTNRVAKISFGLGKLLKFDYISITRGALMHDFFTSKDICNIDKPLTSHPSLAYINSINNFKVNAKEKDIILNHMYPFTRKMPQTKESLLVSLCDKLISIYEFARFKVSYTLSVLVIFIFLNINNMSL